MKLLQDSISSVPQRQQNEKKSLITNATRDVTQEVQIRARKPGNRSQMAVIQVVK
jgi:hypothetical protein